MKHGLLALAVAAASLAAASATACSQAPAPVTRPDNRPQIQKDAGNAPPSSQQAGAAPTATVPIHHSSEAEPKAAQAAPAAAAPAVPAAPAAAAPVGGPAAGAAAGPAPGAPPAGGQASALPAAPPGAVVPLQPLQPAVTATGANGANSANGSDPAAAGAAAAAGATGGAAPKTSDPSLIVVDTADYDPDAQLSLAQAAKAERERKSEAAPPRIVINNKTIHRYAKGGQLTVADPKKKTVPPQSAQPAAGATAATAGPAPAVPVQRDEKYWRGRAFDIRQRWHRAADRIKELEDDVALLRRRFYAEDDPYVRDGQIKPAWDRALDELRESRTAVQAAKKELTDFLDEGRTAGALPGWLREGVDLEPKEEKPVDPTQPIETPIYKDNGR